MERLKIEQEAAIRQAREERYREAEKALAFQRAEEREKLIREYILEPHDNVLSEDLECYSMSTFF